MRGQVGRVRGANPRGSERKSVAGCRPPFPYSARSPPGAFTHVQDRGRFCVPADDHALRRPGAGRARGVSERRLSFQARTRQLV